MRKINKRYSFFVYFFSNFLNIRQAQWIYKNYHLKLFYLFWNLLLLLNIVPIQAWLECRDRYRYVHLKEMLFFVRFFKLWMSYLFVIILFLLELFIFIMVQLSFVILNLQNSLFGYLYQIILFIIKFLNKLYAKVFKSHKTIDM